MRRLFWFFFLHLIVFLILITSHSYAKEKVFTCKPVMASVQLKNGEYYFETLDDEKTPLINQLTVSQFLIDKGDVFYKNNKKRKFERLISTEYFSNLNLLLNLLTTLSNLTHFGQTYSMLIFPNSQNERIEHTQE